MLVKYVNLCSLSPLHVQSGVAKKTAITGVLYSFCYQYMAPHYILCSYRII